MTILIVKTNSNVMIEALLTAEAHDQNTGRVVLRDSKKSNNILFSPRVKDKANTVKLTRGYRIRDANHAMSVLSQYNEVDYGRMYIKRTPTQAQVDDINTFIRTLNPKHSKVVVRNKRMCIAAKTVLAVYSGKASLTAVFVCSDISVKVYCKTLRAIPIIEEELKILLDNTLYVQTHTLETL